MRIVDIRELAVPLEGAVANAVVNFSEHTVSLVALITDVVRHGKPVIGLGFNSIGRFAQSGIIQTRMIPRLLAAAPASLLAEDGRQFDAAKVLATIMRNEKPGGHGDRAGAAAAIELAVWDLNAKLAEEPAYATIARAFGRTAQAEAVEVYTGGGYYYASGAGKSLREEFQSYRDLGFESFKMKIGGAPLAEDMRRVEEALEVAGGPAHLMVDANGRFDLPTALAYAKELKPLGLRWFEEIGDPLDFQLNREAIEAYGGPVATGENLFSAIDTLNLVRFGGMRPGHDIFQMDAGLSYGLTEYARMIEILESHGFDRRQAVPHGGHLINLHIVVGLGLGACEAYPGVFQPFGGYSQACEIRNAKVRPSEAPGFGLEQKRELAPLIRQLGC
ncbi:enolase C-terminal domain-like protein [Comamonas endophytica]|uniref:Mandelate racemase n=1 Tax=Comamonas endophytica TaxID=2949090 RepID=A0ABY6GET7_9BURK|nr:MULTISPECIES: enolase C-terminal domain-like protein [unclassified Acidovorax]MCD2514363.1 mandelate racemase [Acidovorax sp. D4N7]UYG53609.1 mandelate racemase [Acidovorax sp. 5MLIR]UYG53654.1 mandelate racemase [Acidovorax sp. 5MLIR]